MSGSKPAIVVAVTGWDTAPWLMRFRALAPDREVLALSDVTSRLPARYHLFCWKPVPSVFADHPPPLLIASAGAGVDHIFKANPPDHVPITRIVDPDLTGRMVEYVVLHCLMHLRRMPEAAANQRAKAWQSKDFPAARQVTVGLMGVGELGLAAARGLKALGFQVVGWGRSPRADVPFPSFAGPSQMPAFLAQTDMLVSLLPSTADTRGQIGRHVFRGLRHTGAFGAPVFINAGRGDSVNEAELATALTDGTLHAASLDVFVTEPLPQESPFWTMENVILTPHNAADSTPDAVAAAVMAEIDRLEAGQPLLHPVDRTRGY